MIQQDIRKLVEYGLKTGLVEKEDEIYTVNRLLELFELDEIEDKGAEISMEEEELEEVLGRLMDYAVEKGIMKEDGIVYRDLFDTKIMSVLMPRPSEVIREFWKLYKESAENGIISSARIRIISGGTGLRRTRDGKRIPSMGIWILRLTYQNRKKTPKLLRPLRMPNKADIRNACFA